MTFTPGWFSPLPRTDHIPREYPDGVPASFFGDARAVDFVASFLETAEWSAATDNHGDPYRWHPSALDKAWRDAWDFLNAPNVADAVEAGPTRLPADCQQYRFPAYALAGHDFALTRNGHGAGFWDGDWPGEEDTRNPGPLYRASEAAGEINCLPDAGDDGEPLPDDDGYITLYLE
jgi:hypothetical protein